MKGDTLLFGGSCLFVVVEWNIGQPRRGGANYQRPTQVRVEDIHLPLFDLSSQSLDQFKRMNGLVFDYFGAIFSKNIFQRRRGVTKKYQACLGVGMMFRQIQKRTWSAAAIDETFNHMHYGDHARSSSSTSSISSASSACSTHSR